MTETTESQEPHVKNVDGIPPELAPSEMTLLIGSKYVPMADITDPTLLLGARAIKGSGQTLDLGAHVLMGGFLALLSEGAISLRYVEAKKMRVLKTHHVMVERVGDSSYVPPTIESGLFQLVSSEPLSVKKVVGMWFGPNVENPGLRAYMPAWNHLVSLGMIVMKEVPTGKKGKLESVPEPNAQLITQTHPQLARWSERWTTFGTEDGELSEHLFSEIKRTLSWKKKSEDDGSDFSDF